MATLKAIDFLKVDRAAGGYEYILVIIDQLTRYAQAYTTANKSAKTTAEKLFDDLVLKFGTKLGKKLKTKCSMKRKSIWELRDVERHSITL